MHILKENLHDPFFELTRCTAYNMTRSRQEPSLRNDKLNSNLPMEQIITITFVVSWIVLMALNLGVQTIKRTTTTWIEELLTTGTVKGREASGLGTMCSFNLFSDWVIEAVLGVIVSH
jgi:hypothetical protein